MSFDLDKKLIILDRDGVINYDSDNYIKSVSEFVPIPRSILAINTLSSLGWRISIATNQSGIGRSYYTSSTLNAMHNKLLNSLVSPSSIDYIAYCPHHPLDSCTCRKPKKGLFDQISNYYCDSLLDIPYVGDTFKDINAALAYGLSPVLVLSGKVSLAEFNSSPFAGAVPVYADLLDFVNSISIAS